MNLAAEDVIEDLDSRRARRERDDRSGDRRPRQLDAQAEKIEGSVARSVYINRRSGGSSFGAAREAAGRRDSAWRPPIAPSLRPSRETATED